MKRSFLSTIAKSVLGFAILASGIAMTAQTNYAPLKSSDEARPHNSQKVESPMSKAVGRVLPGDPSRQVLPVTDGLQHITRHSANTTLKPASIMRSPEAPRGNIYGVVNRYPSMEYTYEAYVGKLNLVNGKLTPLHYGSIFCPYIADDYVYQANTYRKGQIVCMTFEEDPTSGYIARWDLVDIETGNITDTIYFRDQLADGYSATYDPDLDIFYIVSIDMINGAGDSIFGIVNPNGKTGWEYYHGGRLETSRNAKPYIAALSYNQKDKTLYAFDNDNNVYTVEWKGPDGMNFPEHLIVEYGNIYMSDDGILFECETSNPMAGQIVYSPTDEMFIASYRDNYKQKNRIVYVDPESLEAKFGADISAFSTPYITALFCTDDYAPSEAPMLASDPIISFTKANLSGTATFTAPKESFIGIDLTGTTLKSVVKIDGKTIDERDIKAGDSFTLNLTLEQGEHTMEFTTAIGENVSPVNTTVFYTGYDAPTAPENLKLTGTKLSWDAPGAVGQHKGFVDVADITYDVYLGDKKQNDQPVTATSFTLGVPDQMSLSKISVTATSKGQTSLPGTITKIFGKAFDIPFVQAPTRAQSQLYTVVNANKDVRQFYYSTNLNIYEGMVFVTGYIEDADDWLFLPAINFPDASKLYSFEFDIRGVYTDLPTKESFEIYVADAATVEAAKKGSQIYANYNFTALATDPKHQSFSFGVPEAGDYYLAIHVVSTRDQSSAGMSFHDFTVKEVSGSNSAVPGDPTNVVVAPLPFGEQGVTVNANMPVNDILGNPLPADKNITLTLAYSDDSGFEYAKSVEGLPGAAVTVVNGGNRDGIIHYTLTPSNENGKGYTRSYPVYVGIDIPFHPENIKGVPSDDNFSLHLTWDAPPAIGTHGGFVGLDDLKYRIYTRSGITYLKVADTEDLEYDYYPYGKGVNRGKLETWYVGPAAFNEAGESVESEFVMEALGTPYELPMYEEWNSTLFTYNPYNFMMNGPYSLSSWNNCMSSYGLGIGDPTVVEGAIYTYADGPAKSKLILPKATTKGIAKAIAVFRLWDYAKAPASIQLYGRRSGNAEEVLIGEYKLSRPSRGQWVDAEIALTPEFTDCDWVQLRLGTTLTGTANEYLLIDSFRFVPDADYDLKVTVFDGLSHATVGDEVKYNVSVANAGRERMEGNLYVELVDPEGNVLATDRTEVPQLASSQSFDYEASFVLDGSFRDYEKVTARARLDVEDENTVNNVRELELNIMPSQLPVVNDLQGSIDDDGNVRLSWSAPTATYGNFENFDTYKPFQLTENIGFWQNIDMDKEVPVLFSNDATGSVATWENFEKPQAWTVYDFDKLGMNEERIRPHSGNQAIMARSAMGDSLGNVPQSSKWLVSPEVVPSTTVSLWFSTLTTDYTEYIEIWESETDPASSYLNPDDPNIKLGRCGTFRKKQSFSKLGAEEWEYILYTLTKRARQFAIRYCSFDSYCVVIDDIAFTPANMLTRTPASYSVWRTELDGSNPELIAENITDTNYVDTDFNDHGYKYYVVSNSDIDGGLVSGTPSNYVSLLGSSVGEINAAQSVTAGKGVINVAGFAGAEIAIATADGKIVRKGNVPGASASFATDKGVYIVTIGKRSYKVIVK